MDRRTFLIGGWLGALSLAEYSTLYEAQAVKLTHALLAFDSLPLGKKIRLLHLSDFHYGPVVDLAYIKRVVSKALSYNPDVVCLTGDYITGSTDLDFDAYAAILQPLGESRPFFATFGNHDGGSWSQKADGFPSTKEVGEFLQKAGATVLKNEARSLIFGDSEICFVGLGDLWSDELRPREAFADATSSCRVVLSHNPDSKDLLKPFSWDLLLSGHTHGGQVCIPFLGAPFAPVQDKRFLSGLYQWEGRQLFVTRGVGNLHGVRFNCPPEIAILDLNGYKK